MKKLLLAGMLFITGCSFYNVNVSGRPATDGLSPMAIISNQGYLSSDVYNEITPFLYRASDKTFYLFYSSDKDGTYDIYFARMTHDGLFYPPVKLSANVNTTNGNEFSPIVFNNGGGIYMTYLKKMYDPLASDGSNANLESCELDSSLNYVGKGIGTENNYIHCGLFYYNGSSQLYIMSPSNVLSSSSYFWTSSTNWDSIYPKSLNSELSLSSAQGFVSNIIFSQTILMVTVSVTNEFTCNLYEAKVGGYYHIAIGGQIISKMVTNGSVCAVIPEYTEEGFNDRWPFVNFYDGSFDVYFSSDRYGLTNYDLYRQSVIPLNKTELYTNLMNALAVN